MKTRREGLLPSTSMSRLLATAALVAMLAQAPDAFAQAGRQVGVAAAVTGQVQLAAGGGAARAGVRSGEAIRLGDQIATGPDSKLQIMLADETVFTIGPNAAITIDEFVFDAPTGRGRLSANIARGAFRFVTGRIAANNPQDMKVTMPVGTMGIRGTVVAGQVSAERALVVLLGPGDQNNAAERMGRVLVSGSDASKGSVELRRPGFATEIARDGAPSRPFRLDTAALDGILRALSNDRGRAARAGAGGDSPEELAEIETAAGGDGLTGGSGQGLVDGLRGINSFAEITAMLDRPIPIFGAAGGGPLVLRVPDALVRTVDLRTFNGATVFPVSVFALNGGSLPGFFSITAAFDHGAGRVDGTLVVDYGGVRESFPLSVLFPRGGFAASPGQGDVSRALPASVAPGITLFAFTSDRAERLIEYRYMLMRSDPTLRSTNPTRPDQLLNGMTYETAADRAAGRTTAVGAGIAQTTGPAIPLTGAAQDVAARALELTVKR